MKTAVKSPSSALKQSGSLRDECLRALRVIYSTRLMDDKMSKLVRQNKGGTFYLNVTGHEMIGAVAALSLEPKKDWGLPYYRDRAFALGIGCSYTDIIAAFLGRDIPHHSGGRMMPEHFSHKELRLPAQSSCVGSQFLQAVGVGLGIKLRGEDEVVYVSAGDGATSQGDFHEALNFSCLHKLPVVFVIQDNGWAISVPVKDQTTGGSIAPIGRGYANLTVHDINGADYTECKSAMDEAVKKARAKKGPSLIVAHVPRLGPHSSSDDPKKYKDDETIECEQKRDPIPFYEKWLVEAGFATEASLQTMKKTIALQIEAASKEAEELPYPKKESAATKVFKEFEVPESSSLPRGESVVIIDALHHAFEEEMKRDPNMVVFGQDVADGKGGVFGITRSLSEKFGKERCFNTPLAESTIIGVALGLSFDGKHKSVAEIQFCDYHWTAVNQLYNELASIHYRSNGEWNCPVVIRMPCGGYIQGGPYHSQSIEGYLCHCPGLKVAIPSNAADAKRLLKTAIRDPNPVVFLEHKALYRQRAFCAQPEPHADELLPFGKAKVVREGTDLTVVCWGMMVMMAVEIADVLKKEGISVEVVDLRTLAPFDLDAILESVEKTSKLLIAHEASKTGGFGGEIAAQVQEKGFMHLDAPIARIAGKDCMVPYSKILEDEVLPQKKDLESAIRNLAAY